MMQPENSGLAGGNKKEPILNCLTIQFIQGSYAFIKREYTIEQFKALSSKQQKAALDSAEIEKSQFLEALAKEGFNYSELEEDFTCSLFGGFSKVANLFGQIIGGSNSSYDALDNAEGE